MQESIVFVTQVTISFTILDFPIMTDMTNVTVWEMPLVGEHVVMAGDDVFGLAAIVRVRQLKDQVQDRVQTLILVQALILVQVVIIAVACVVVVVR
jgi:predicted DNA repair protein MutK